MLKFSFGFGRVLSAAVLGSVVILAIPVAHAEASHSAQAASAVNAVGDEADATLTAKIVKVYPQSNSIAVKGPEGDTVVVNIDPATADVKHLKAGDEVNLAYRGELVMALDKADPKGARGRVEAEYVSPASNGVVTRSKTVQVVATIVNLNPETREVTLAGPKRTVSMNVSQDIDMTRFKVGDSVIATYAAATAISVSRNGQIVK